MKNCLKRKASMILAVLVVTLTLSSCSSQEGLPLNQVVMNILAENNIEKSKITYICERSNETVSLYEPEEIKISDDDLKKYVDDLLVLHEKMIEITDRNIVQKGDVIVVSYVVYYNSQIVASVQSDPLMVGSGNYFEDFENAIIGAIVGEPFVCELTSPVDTEKYNKGDTLKYNVTVESINQFESYGSSDQYILNYYGVKTEEEFLSNCKIRLEKLKKYEISVLLDDNYLDKIAEKCRFYIDKQEAATYSKKIVKQYEDLAYISGLELNKYVEQILNMTEDEFYDFCYNEGVKEIKQYLLVGASGVDVSFDNEFGGNKYYKEFCSICGYDSTQNENTSAKFAHLKTITVNYFRRLVDSLSLVKPNMDFEKIYTTVRVFDSSNRYTINYSENKGYTVSDTLKNEIIRAAAKCEFGKSIYEQKSIKNLYDTVIVFETDCAEKMIWTIDTTNGYLKWENKDGSIFHCILPPNFEELIEQVKH